MVFDAGENGRDQTFTARRDQMTAPDERTALAQATQAAGWRRRELDRVDVYLRGLARVRVIWQGNDAISGGSRFHDDIMEQYSRDLTTVKGWLIK
jgi:hypothetical protein